MSVWLKLKRFCTSSYWRKNYFLMSFLGRTLPDCIWLRLKYKVMTEKKLNLKYPQTFNEKMQWLKINNKNPVYTQMVDKYAVREYLKRKLGEKGEKYLIPLVGGPYATVEEIDFSKLPEQFVLKCTRDSGNVIICKERSCFDIIKAKKQLKKLLKSNFYYTSREWPYKKVKPQIIAEKYMENDEDQELKDYKLMCFNSKVKAIFVCSERFKKSGLKITVYDENWKRLLLKRGKHPTSMEKIPKPKRFEDMKELAEKLSKGIPFVRVDFYENNGNIYFGEFTFFPESGYGEFYPQEWDLKLGEWIELPFNQ